MRSLLLTTGAIGCSIKCPITMRKDLLGCSCVPDVGECPYLPCPFGQSLNLKTCACQDPTGHVCPYLPCDDNQHQDATTCLCVLNPITDLPSGCPWIMCGLFEHIDKETCRCEKNRGACPVIDCPSGQMQDKHCECVSKLFLQ